MAKETNANIGFEKELWDAACVLWGHIPAADYRKVIIGLIFLRYVSSAFDKRYKELVEEGYATWLFQSSALEGPSKKHGIISIKPLGNSLYQYLRQG